MEDRVRKGLICVLLFVGGFSFCLAFFGALIMVTVLATDGNKLSIQEKNIDYMIQAGTASWHFDPENPLMRQRKIVVTTDINELTMKEVVSTLFYLDAQSNTEPIDLFISTLGGYGEDAYGIVDVMHSISAPVNVWAFGICYSSGAIILAAGTGRRYAFPNTLIGIHLDLDEGSDGHYSSQAEEVRRERAFWKDVAEIPDEWLLGDKDNVWYYLNAHQAVSYGVIDEIAGGRPAE